MAKSSLPFRLSQAGVLSVLLTFSFMFATVKSTNVVCNLTILHTNDLHGKFEQIEEYACGPCSEELAGNGMCFGGYARRVTKIKEIRDLEENVLLLEAGERLLGLPAWFDTYRGLATSHFMNWIGYDAMALGSYDFFAGIPGVLPFLNNVTFPIVMSNVDSSQEPRMQDLFVTDHVVELTNGERVGIVGYIWELTPNYKDIGDLIINPIINSLQVAVDSLVSRGINKIIALGHASFEDSKRVARMVRGVDVVVSGANYTLLYNGSPPSIEDVVGPYPLVINPDHDPDATVLVVTTYRYGKYLGYLNVGFDNEGAVRTYNGNAIFLDNSITQDADALEEVEEWSGAIREVENEIVGESLVRLYGLIDRCGIGECNMINLVADAMVWEWANSTSSDGWTDVTLAMINIGSLYAEQEAGPITFGDVKSWLVYADTYDLVDLQGRHILAALEHSAASHGLGNNWRFIQVSGMLVILDMTKPIGSRVQSVEVLCSDCDIPEYVPLEEDKNYRVVVNSYIAGGGDEFDIVRDSFQNREKGRVDVDIVRDYLKSTSPVSTGLDHRMVVYDSNNPPPPPPCRLRNPLKLRKQPSQ